MSVKFAISTYCAPQAPKILDFLVKESSEIGRGEAMDFMGFLDNMEFVDNMEYGV